jgi:hypothetical protein
MNTPNLHFLQTIAPLLAKTPPVVGISPNHQVRIVLAIDRQILQAHIACPTAPTSILQRNILSAIDQAQTLRHQRIQALISQYAQPTKLSLWDIEATLLALRQLRLAPASSGSPVSERSRTERGLGGSPQLPALRNYHPSRCPPKLSPAPRTLQIPSRPSIGHFPMTTTAIAITCTWGIFFILNILLLCRSD